MSEPGHNRLGDELSPYLLQHAHNPVHWYPWGEEALSLSRAEDRPILLSVGYSACHWCHVMERESFEDAETAKLMNELFVNVKVDREERPDLDQIYQLTVQLMGRSGGWPLTVFLTPKLEPFYAGTYFPPVERHGMPSFRTVLAAVHDAYASRREEVERSATEITRAIGQVTSARAEAVDPPPNFLERAARHLTARFDDVHGGFGQRPKFPNTMALEVFLRAHHRHGDPDALARVVKALDAMREGGIRDQLGGGFHRYSTDERWLVPHFEKMLYDNALLLRLYVDGWRATGEARFADEARSVARYVVREMTSSEGGFYSTQDADSEGEEGRFFVWTPEQLDERLSPEEAQAAKLSWGVGPGGNFEQTGASVLHASRPLGAVAAQMGRREEEVRAWLESARAKLLAAREERAKPFRDEKIIATWNGLLIGALAEAGAALGEPELVEHARRGLDFVRRELFREGRLLRIYKDGRARIDGFLEDWADVACAALDLFEATGDGGALDFARQLVEGALARFWDEEGGGFFFAEGAEDLIVRAKDAVDNAVPSGASSMCHALLRLHGLTGDPRHLSHAERTLRSLAGQALEQPLGFGHLLGALDRYVHGPTQVVVVAAAGDPAGEALLAEARRAHLPNRVLARVDPEAPEEAGGPAAVLGGRRQEGGRATAYVCRDRACGLPLGTAAALREALRR